MLVSCFVRASLDLLSLSAGRPPHLPIRLQLLMMLSTARPLSRPASRRNASSAAYSIGRPMRVACRIAAPNKPLTTDEREELSRLESSDAFAKLVELNEQKQSVNRPQKVIQGPQRAGSVGACSSAVVAAAAVSRDLAQVQRSFAAKP